MRILKQKEVTKRGCNYCMDMERHKVEKEYENGNKHMIYSKFCPHDRCPYRELDKFETYDDYMKVCKKKKKM